MSFALGTDTADSDRVPAGFNNIVGLKPSRSLVSARGVTPACRTLDCVSVFALDTSDALHVLKTMTALDDDPYSRALPVGVSLEEEADFPDGVKSGAPFLGQRNFLGDGEARKAYDRSLERIEEMDVTVQEVDFSPFYETAKLVYEGPWMAERLAAIEEFLQTKPKSSLSSHEGFDCGRL